MRELPEALVEMTRTVRRVFHQLKAVSTALHADIGITASVRGVLETIQREGPSTVPRMARMRPVSRQHIQRIVDELLERDLLRLDVNPDHKRSPLVSMTEKGRATFHTMAQRELALFSQLTDGLSQNEVAVTRKVLDQLQTRLTGMLAEQGQTFGDDLENAV
jgi:DNA-binding MarR family transcriptional regulator